MHENIYLLNAYRQAIYDKTVDEYATSISHLVHRKSSAIYMYHVVHFERRAQKQLLLMMMMLLLLSPIWSNNRSNKNRKSATLLSSVPVSTYCAIAAIHSNFFFVIFMCTFCSLYSTECGRRSSALTLRIAHLRSLWPRKHSEGKSSQSAKWSRLLVLVLSVAASLTAALIVFAHVMSPHVERGDTVAHTHTHVTRHSFISFQLVSG